MRSLGPELSLMGDKMSLLPLSFARRLRDRLSRSPWALASRVADRRVIDACRPAPVSMRNG